MKKAAVCFLISLSSILFGCGQKYPDTESYKREEDKVYQDVLADLLKQDFITGMASSIPPPTVALTNWLDTLHYYDDYLATETDYYNGIFLLNLSETLRSLPESLKGLHFLIDASNNKDYFLALEKSGFYKDLDDRGFDKKEMSNLWKYKQQKGIIEKPYDLYETNLLLSRVCFNKGLDTAFFYYEFDHTAFIEGAVALAIKEKGKWKVIH